MVLSPIVKKGVGVWRVQMIKMEKWRVRACPTENRNTSKGSTSKACIPFFAVSITHTPLYFPALSARVRARPLLQRASLVTSSCRIGCWARAENGHRSARTKGWEPKEDKLGAAVGDLTVVKTSLKN
ncbi:hypothetical protein IRJ41_003584 [Triplophysa rosa]|uniref:Uncharacterized protein n=1 Tax=Triplophysa rosa TaxID=992332 RepID=A0A9W7WXM7_TRIRA|nr:hypothetical protein IRJ41_003584 [Triplophysa rosa]